MIKNLFEKMKKPIENSELEKGKIHIIVEIIEYRLMLWLVKL